MTCPECGSTETHTVRNERRWRTRSYGRGRFRTYLCERCKRRFSTMEFPVTSRRDAEAAEALA